MATKYFCDRCDKETPIEHEVKFKYSEGWGLKRKYFYMCLDCLKKVESFIKNNN